MTTKVGLGPEVDGHQRLDWAGKQAFAALCIEFWFAEKVTASRDEVDQITCDDVEAMTSTRST